MDDGHEDVPGTTNPGQNDFSGYNDEIPYYEHIINADNPTPKALENNIPTPVAPPTNEVPVAVEPESPRPRQRRGLLYAVGAGTVLLALMLSSALVVANTMQQKGRQAVVPTPQAATPVQARFQTAPCPFTPDKNFVEGVSLTCGFVTVPEEHSNPRSQAIKLAVAIFRNSHGLTTRDAAGGPVVYLDGGPGGPTLQGFAPQIGVDYFERLASGHDLILFDQRGVGKSLPALNCPETANIQDSPYYTREKRVDLIINAYQRCYTRLNKSGVHISAYNTIENASDVHDLIHALGYQQANLYGVSYGTRLALTVMRLYPGDLRSVVLDSTVPTQENLFNQQAAVTQRAFDVLLRGCKASIACNKAYPDLENVFYKLVSDWNARPHTVSDGQGGEWALTGDDVANILWESQYVTEFIPELPRVIWQLSQDDRSALLPLTASSGEEVHITRGMYYSVECGEDAAYTSRVALEQSTRVLHAELRDGMRRDMFTLLSICQTWQQNPVPAIQKQPVVSSVSTLILAGEYDPITPPDNAREAAQTLDHSSVFQFPATGHGVLLTNACPDKIIASFLLQPTRKPDGSCIVQMHGPAFV